MSAPEAVAIVGAACRLPGAPDLAAFWRNLRAGADTISRFSTGELLAAGVPADQVRHPDYVPARGLLPGGERFDWPFFGYTRAAAGTIDPQQRVFLEVCWAALNDAGLVPARFPGWVGVFAGSDLATALFDPDDPQAMERLIGAEKDFLATRVAYKLGLRGPAISVQTACSTSLVAVHQASQSLLNHECDAALAGGVTLRLPQATGYLYRPDHIVSVDGRCRSFDADSSGTVSSNGAAVVVLRRLDDARADGDRVMAVLRGSALNNDGGEKIGYTAPSLTGQRDVIRLALAQSDVDPADLVHVEAHGTATQVGDPVEVAALTAAFRQSTDRVGYCWLGSVKSNIGHTGAAAGVAGLLKTALMLEHREVVPSVHFRAPNPRLELERSPFRVVTERQPLDPDRPAVAAVSSFGIGGTNAHAALETPPPASGGRGPRVFCLSAHTPQALRRSRTELADVLEAPDGCPAPDPVTVAWTLASGRPALPHRAAVVAEDLGAAVEALRDTAGAPAAAGQPRVALVFPGQGALYPGAVDAARELLPTFGRIFDEAAGLARRNWEIDLAAAVRADAAPLRDSLLQQVGLFAVGYGLGRQLLEWGVRPVALLGHSAGEYVAAALAGVWDLADGLELVAARALAMREGPPGRMLAVYAPLAEVTPLLAGRDLTVATDGPGQVVVAGPAEVVEALHAELPERGLTGTPLDADRPFHTEAMRPTAAALRAALARLPGGPAELPVVSNRTGAMAEPEHLADPGYWSDHLASPVLLTAGMSTLLRTGADVVVEVGPGQTMTSGLRHHPEWTDTHTAVALLGRAAQPRRETLLAALGALWTAGVPVDWESLFTERPTRCSLPPTALDSRPCPAPGRPAADRATGAAGLVVVGDDPHRTAEVAEDLAATGIRVTASLALDQPDHHRVLGGWDWPPCVEPTLSGRPDLVSALSAYCAGLVGRLALDTAGLVGGDTHTRSALIERFDPGRRLLPMAEFLVSVLVEQGWLTGADAALTAVPDLDARVRGALACAGALDEVAGLRRLVEHCVHSCPDVFAGRREVVEVLHPDGTDDLLRGCLTDNLVAVSDAEPCLQALVRALPGWRAGPQRVLEVGAGRGELTWRLLDAWPGPVTYHATDVSPLLVSELDRQAAGRGEARLRTRVFDITADPVSQGLVPGSYDLILGYDVVHVAPSIPAALGHLRRLLRRDGTLCLVELTRAQRWTHLVWGMAPGWWIEGDPTRSASPHLDGSGWTTTLGEAGFDATVAAPADHADHAVLTGTLADRDRYAAPAADIDRQASAPTKARDTGGQVVPGSGSTRPVRAVPAVPESAAPSGDRLVATVTELWCAALGVSSVSGQDDFAAAGGDSLGMVHLLGRVRERTGVRVAMADFVASPTFDTLVGLVRQGTATGGGTGSPGPSNLVRLHEHGDGTPLFLAAPGAGSTLCYRHLAPLLGPPVYGLDSPGLHDGSAPLTRLEDVARASLRLVREVQPHGPYRLGGWSVGAMVAHEMAGQLRDQGEPVDLLLCVDGFVPRTWGRPVGVRPDYLAKGLWYQLQTRLPFGARNLGSALTLAGVGDGRSRGLGSEFVRVYNANVRAMLRYVPRPVDCAALILHTGLTERAWRRVCREVAATYRGGVRVVGAPGDHWSVLDQRHVGDLATQVRTALDRPTWTSRVPAGGGSDDT